MAYTGLLQVIANWFASIATPFIYPLIVMIAAGVIQLFIPSSEGSGWFRVRPPSWPRPNWAFPSTA